MVVGLMGLAHVEGNDVPLTDTSYPYLAAHGSLPRLVPFKPGVSLDDLHEYSLKRR